MYHSVAVLLLAICCVILTTVDARSRSRHRNRFSDSDSPDDTASSGVDSLISTTQFTTRHGIPDFVRVEIEVLRLENPGGILANGKKCDFFKSCDPRVYATIDAEDPLSPWPGPVTALKWPAIFEASDTNSPTIGRSVNKDVCGGAFGKVNLRVHVVDVDSFSANDDLMNFDCLFDIEPQDIAHDADSADWGPSVQCKAAGAGKIRLYTRQRVYQIPPSDCRADGNENRLAGTSAASTDGGNQMPDQHDLVRVDAELVQLLNPQGIAANGKACDSTSACDPIISAYLDTEKPLSQWPGSKTVPDYTTIFKVSNVNSPTINKNISKNICGGSLNKVNLRVHVLDADTAGQSDLIGDFQCLFTVDYRLIASDVSSTDWSPTQDCSPIKQKNDIRLQYRFRVYDIPSSQCGISLTGN